MAIIHKLVQAGAEDYLPLLLARERVIRRQRSNNADGEMSGGYGIKYDFGDGIEGELRMVGNQSFVRLSVTGDVNVSRTWVAFMFEPDTQFSDSNNVPIFNGPQDSKRPTPPEFVTPDTGTEPVFDSSKFRYPTGGLVPGSDEYPTIDGPQIEEGTVGEANDIRAEYISGLLKELSVGDRVGARSYPKPTKDKNGEYEYALNFGITFHKALETKTFTFPGNPPVTIIHTYYRAWDTYTPANDVEVAHIKWFLDEKKPYIAAANATFAAAYAEWQAELAEWRATVLAEWEAKNVLEQVCPPYFKDLLGKQREGRSAQVAALYAEMRKGMGSLCIASPALHPQYMPKEEPSEELAVTVAEWVGPGKYVDVSESWTSEYTTAIYPVCDGVRMRARTYVNAYPYSPPDAQNSPYVSLDQGFGYRVNGTLYDLDRSKPGATVRLLPQYQDWLESDRRPAQNVVSFDLLYGNVPGEVYIALFEFYGYDFKTEQWMWSPSIDLLNTNPLRSCYTICFSYPDHEREAAYADRPDAMQQIAQVRSYAFLKHTKTPTGWSPAINVSAPQIVVSVSNVSLGDIPAVWCAVNGVQDWMLPASPDPNIAVDAAFMATSNPSTPGQVGSIGELKEWIHAQCLSRFQIPFK